MDGGTIVNITPIGEGLSIIFSKQVFGENTTRSINVPRTGAEAIFGQNGSVDQGLHSANGQLVSVYEFIGAKGEVAHYSIYDTKRMNTHL